MGNIVSSGRAALLSLKVNYAIMKLFFSLSQHSTREFKAELKESLNHKTNMVTYVYIAHPLNIYKVEAFRDVEFNRFPEKGETLILALGY